MRYYLLTAGHQKGMADVTSFKDDAADYADMSLTMGSKGADPVMGLMVGDKGCNGR